MTKKDFQLIADVIRTAPIEFEAQKAMARAFADRLERDNERFNRATFTNAACGVILLSM